MSLRYEEASADFSMEHVTEMFSDAPSTSIHFIDRMEKNATLCGRTFELNTENEQSPWVLSIGKVTCPKCIAKVQMCKNVHGYEIKRISLKNPE